MISVLGLVIPKPKQKEGSFPLCYVLKVVHKESFLLKAPDKYFVDSNLTLEELESSS